MKIDLHCQSCPWHRLLTVRHYDDMDTSDMDVCPICGGKVVSTVVNQGSV